MTPTSNDAKLSLKDAISSVFYVEFGVVIVAESIDPNSISELFLRHHSVIDDNDEVFQDPILTPVFAQLAFKNGLSITCDGNRLLVVQKGEFSDADRNRCPDITLKYLDYAPTPNVNAIGINFKQVLQSHEIEMTRFFHHKANWATFGSIVPSMQFKAIYQCDQKRINLNVSNAIKRNDPGFKGILHHANIHRDVGADLQELGIDRVLQIVNDWQSDLNDFNVIVNELYYRNDA